MKVLLSSVAALCLLTAVSVFAAEESEIEAGTVAECRANVAAFVLIKQNEGWNCSLSSNTANCNKDGVSAIIYCNGSKAVISMHKD